MKKIGLGADFNHIGGRGRYEGKLNLSEDMLKAMVSIECLMSGFKRFLKFIGTVVKASEFNEDYL